MRKSLRYIFAVIAPLLLFAACTSRDDLYPDAIEIHSSPVVCTRPGITLEKPLKVEVLGPVRRGLLGGKGQRSPVPAATVHFSILANNTNIWFPDGTSVETDQGGYASLRVHIGNTLGDHYVKAAVQSQDGSERSVIFRIVAGIEKLNNNQEALAGHTCSQPFSIRVFDITGAPLPGAMVYFSLNQNEKRVSISRPYCITDQDGIAGVYAAAGDHTGEAEILAEVEYPGKILSFRGLRFKVMILNQTSLIISLLGGLAIFIFGMKIMAEGLQRVAGSRLKNILQLFVRNRLVGVLVGTGVTAVIQSSSATTVMVVGFVNAGLLTLRQAISVIYGSSIGTTITAQIIAFKLTKIALPTIIIGLVIQMVSKRMTTKFWGEVLLGFGLLFFGMSMMSDTLVPLRESPTFISFFHGFDCSPVNGIMPFSSVLWAVLIGTAMTAIVQSSSATVGLVMALAASGLINFYTAVPLVLGDNIGTTITANLAAIGTNRSARRAAIANTVIKVSGTLFMVGLFYYTYDGVPVFLYFINMITPGNVLSVYSENIARHIAMAHTMFNVCNVIILLPLVNQLAWLCEKILPIKTTGVEQRHQYLEQHLLETPPLAFVQITKELAYMTRRSMKMVEEAYRCLAENTLKWEDSIRRREEIVDQLQTDLSEYIADLTGKPLTEQESSVVPELMHAVHDAERVGDLAMNIFEQAERRIRKNIELSDDAIKDLHDMFTTVDHQCGDVVEALRTGNLDSARQAIAHEKKINDMQRRLSSRNMKRLESGVCSTRSGVMFLEIVTNLERIGDHLVNIAERIHAIALFEPEDGKPPKKIVDGSVV